MKGKRYFTSDHHWGHSGVIKHCKRPFLKADGQPDIVAMHREMKTIWNSTVTIVDIVYFLGDWCLSPKWYFMLKYLKFGELWFILGNHDRKTEILSKLAPGGELDYLADRIHVVSELDLKLKDGNVYHLVHRPICGSDEKRVLCGHVHEKWRYLTAGSHISESSKSKEADSDRNRVKVISTPILNVGVDVHNFKPISEEEVLAYFATNVRSPTVYVPDASIVHSLKSDG